MTSKYNIKAGSFVLDPSGASPTIYIIHSIQKCVKFSCYNNYHWLHSMSFDCKQFISWLNHCEATGINLTIID